MTEIIFDHRRHGPRAMTDIAPRWKATATAPHVGSQHLIEITSLTGTSSIVGGHLRLTDTEATDLLAILARCPEFTTLDARPNR